MNNVEEKIERIITDMTPNEFENIEKELKPKKAFWGFFKPALVMGLALMIGVSGWFAVSNNNKLLGRVGIDVNPSLELEINNKEKVMAVITNNQDAIEVVGDMELEGASLEVALNAIIGAMYQKGYLNENANSILVTFTNDKLKNATVEIVDESLKNENFALAVITQKIEENEQLNQLATENNISVSKANLIQTIVSQDNNIHTVAELKDLSINELSLIAVSKEVKEINVTGDSSQGEYIGQTKAEEIALARYNLTVNQVTNLDSEIDYEHGKMIYEVEFNYDNKEYDVEIEALTGNVLTAEYEIEDDKVVVSEEIKINVTKAKEIALADAQVTDYTDYEIDLEDGVYDVDFEANGYEYEYKINANNGEIISKLKEKDDDHTNSLEVKISANKAKEIALADAQVTDYTDYEIELENGIYELEFKAGGYEYEYQIDASNGNIVKKDKELND